jgi:ATP-dependent Lon protease
VRWRVAQDVIEELDVAERLKKTLLLTKRELSLSDLTQKIKECVLQEYLAVLSATGLS